MKVGFDLYGGGYFFTDHRIIGLSDATMPHFTLKGDCLLNDNGDPFVFEDAITHNRAVRLISAAYNLRNALPGGIA